MRNLHRFLLFLAAAAAAGGVFMFGPGCAAAEAEPIAVVVHPSNAVDGVSSLEMAKILHGQRVLWPDGQRIFVVQPHEASSVYRRFVSLILDPTSMKKERAPQAGLGTRVLNVSGSEAVVNMVKAMPNSIGYASWSSVSGADGVKVIKVDGFLPEDSGYRLKE